MVPIGGDTRLESNDANIESHMQLHGEGGPSDPNERAEPVSGSRSRANAFADRTRARVSDTVDRAGELFERRSDLSSAVRDNPLIALGSAFAVGLVIAAVTGGRQRHWLVDRVRRQIRAAVIGGLTATLAHELRAIAGIEDGFADLIRSLLDEHDLPDLDDLDDELPDFTA